MYKATTLTITEDEWEFPLEQALHPPLVAALS